MFSHQQISRWLSFPLDPVAIEDYLANREFFGEEKTDTPETEQLEIAYQIETIRAAKSVGNRQDVPLEITINGFEPSGLRAEEDYILVAPASGRVPLELTITVGETKPRRVVIPPMDFLVVPVEVNQPLKIKAQNFKDWWSASGGKTRLIIDTRGRPINFLDGKGQRELIAKIKSQLS